MKLGGDPLLNLSVNSGCNCGKKDDTGDVSTLNFLYLAYFFFQLFYQDSNLSGINLVPNLVSLLLEYQTLHSN